MDSASLLSRESTTLSLANPQKGHFMALASNSHSVTPPNSLSFRRLSEAREEESAVWPIPEIVTVGFIPHITQVSSQYSVEYRVILSCAKK
jgi:hypothetical protein